MSVPLPEDPSSPPPQGSSEPTVTEGLDRQVLTHRRQPAERQPLTAELGVTPPPAPEPGSLPLTRLGEYELLQELGRGGMGVVFRARHVRLNRIVALKMILGGLLARPDDLQRFDTEVAAAAQLQHPNIVALFEAGTHENQPYFSMEFISGSSLALRLLQGPLPGRIAAGYLEKTARAVHYAHTRNILHRDLKPANVLLDENDEPKVTDFGLAKVLQTESGQTRTGAVIGTPSYMSPEQAAARRDLGPASDIWSLGAILYELLTGKPPFRGESPLATLTMVAQDDPVPPHLLNPQMDLDLETICLKCLEKEPSRRYQSANDLADDLRRYLHGEPIAARRLGRFNRLVKWCRRKPAAAALVAVSVVALLGLILGLAAFAVVQGQAAVEERELRIKALEAKIAAQQAVETMSRLLYLADMRQVHQAWEAADLDRAGRLLDRWRLLSRDRIDPRDWEWYHFQGLCRGRHVLAGHPGRATAVAFRPDGRYVASAGGEPGRACEVKIWDVRTGLLTKTLRGHSNSITALAYSPDGKYLVSTSGDRTVRLWDPEAGTQLGMIDVPPGVAAVVSTLPTGVRAAGLGWLSGAATFLDRRFARHTNFVNAVAFHPTGRLLATASQDGTVKVWDLTRARQGGPSLVMRTLRGHRDAVTSVAFSPDGRLLATAGKDRTVRLWDAATGRLRRPLVGHQGEVTALAFSRDSHILVSAGGRGLNQGELLLWDIVTGSPMAAHLGLSDRILTVAFGSGKAIAAGAGDGVVRVWPHALASEAVRFHADTQAVFALAFSPDGRRLVTAGRDGRVRLWNPHHGQETALLPADALTECLAFSPDSRKLAIAGGPRGKPGEVKVRDVDTGRLLHLFRAQPREARPIFRAVPLLAPFADPRVEHTAAVRSVAFSPDGKRLLSGGDDGIVRIHDLADRAPALQLKGHVGAVLAVAYCPTGERVASAGADAVVRVWDAKTGKLLLPLKGHSSSVRALAFSPHNGQLASAGDDLTVRVWDLNSTNASDYFILRGHTAPVNAVAFSPDGQHLATGSNDKTIRVWDLSERKEDYRLEGSIDKVVSVAYHKDGRRLASTGADRAVRLWDLATLQEILELQAPGGPATCVVFSPDGRLLACAGHDAPVRIWEGGRPGKR